MKTMNLNVNAKQFYTDSVYSLNNAYIVWNNQGTKCLIISSPTKNYTKGMGKRLI